MRWTTLLLVSLLAAPAHADVPDPDLRSPDGGAAAESDPWEAVSLRVGGIPPIPLCRDFQVGEQSRSSCAGIGGLVLDSDLRPAGPLLLRGLLMVGASYNTDVELVHRNSYESIEGTMPLSHPFVRAGFAIGLALPLPEGELRVAGGPGLYFQSIDHAQAAAVEAASGLVFTPISRTSLQGELTFGLDGQPHPKVRLGFRYRAAVGNEVRFEHAAQPDLGEDWIEEINAQNEAWDADIELGHAWTFAFSAPMDEPVSFFVELGPALQQSFWTVENQEAWVAAGGDIFATNLTTDQSLEHRVSPGFWAAIGLQFNIGRRQ